MTKIIYCMRLEEQMTTFTAHFEKYDKDNFIIPIPLDIVKKEKLSTKKKVTLLIQKESIILIK